MICAHCGKPMRPEDARYPFKKYHTECMVAANKIQKKKQYQARRQYYIDKAEAYKKRQGKKCECCGVNPIAEGFRKLCHLCYEWDGQGWREYAVFNQCQNRKAIREANEAI